MKGLIRIYDVHVSRLCDLKTVSEIWQCCKKLLFSRFNLHRFRFWRLRNFELVDKLVETGLGAAKLELGNGEVGPTRRTRQGTVIANVELGQKHVTTLPNRLHEKIADFSFRDFC